MNWNEKDERKYQEFLDSYPDGLYAERRLNSIAADHMAVVHPDGSPCQSGCDELPDPDALRRYLKGE